MLSLTVQSFSIIREPIRINWGPLPRFRGNPTWWGGGACMYLCVRVCGACVRVWSCVAQYVWCGVIYVVWFVCVCKWVRACSCVCVFAL